MPPTSLPPPRSALRPFVPKYDAQRVVEPHGLAGVVWRFFARTAWSSTNASRSGAIGLFWRIARIAYLTTSGFLRDHCLSRAAALTYITVLSLVPMLALSFSMAKGFGFYGNLRDQTIDPFLDETFGPLPAEHPVIPLLVEATSEKSQVLRGAFKQVLDFVDLTNMTALGWFGLVLLVFTAIKLLASIEDTFNDIWGAQRARSWIRKVTDYLAILVVTPLFVFIATGLTAATQSSAVYRWIAEFDAAGWVLDAGMRVLPLLTLWLGFAFVYLALPNARTRLLSAVLGGIVAGTLWQGMLILHVEFQVGIARYNALYSTFAALPVFLMWIHFSWVAVLLGAEICNAHQSEPSCSFPGEVPDDEQAFREALALRAASRIGAAFLEGAPAWTAPRIAQDLALTPRPVEEVLERLVARGVLVEAGPRGEFAYLPARDLGQITTKHILDAMRGTSGFDARASRSPLDEQVAGVLAGFDAESLDSRHNRTLRSLAEAALRAQAQSSMPAQGTEAGPLPGTAPVPSTGT